MWSACSLSGSQATVELCRRENDGLLSSITFFRSRQVTPKFMAMAANGTRVPVSLADILVLSAFAAVKRCSGGAINVQGLAVGRSDASVADEALLPGVSDFTDDSTPHNAAFQVRREDKQGMLCIALSRNPHVHSLTQQISVHAMPHNVLPTLTWHHIISCTVS
jgi:Peroxidase